MGWQENPKYDLVSSRQFYAGIKITAFLKGNFGNRRDSKSIIKKKVKMICRVFKNKIITFKNGYCSSLRNALL